MANHFTSLAIQEIREETPESYSLHFSPKSSDWLSYKAGQYLTLRLDIDGVEYRRAYSLSSSPLVDKQLSIGIKRVQGGVVSNYLQDQLQVGDPIESMRPMGGFVFEPQVDRGLCYVLIGGGSGITPLLSILKTILHGEPLSVVYLWYGNRTVESIMYREELEALRKQFPDRLFIRHSLTQPPHAWKGPIGRLTTEVIYDWLSELFMTDEHRKRYYLCGPAGLMDDAERAMDKHAVNPSHINREWFSAPVPTEEQVEQAYTTQEEKTADTPPPLEPQEITLTLDGATNTLLVQPDETVLDAAIEANLDPPYACRAGICTTCMAKLVAGNVRMDQTMGLSQTDMDAGYILTCQSHPLDEGVDIVFE